LDFKTNSNQELWTDILISNAITIELAEKGKATSDPIELLIKRLSKNPLWQNGEFPKIELPSTATIEQVASKVFQMISFDQGRVTSYKILQIKKVQISGSLPDRYTTVLVQTNLGEKIVLLKYGGETLGWWSRVYDKE